MSARAVARWIEVVSWNFVALGLLLPLAYSTPLFAVYRDAIAEWAYGQATIPPQDERLLGLMLGITGGSIAGKWIVHALIARGPLAEGRSWARDLTIRGLAAWFLVDSVASVMIGAFFNVWVINLVPVVLVGIPLFLSWQSFKDDRASPAEDNTARACLWASLFGATTGIGIAFGGETLLFALWWQGLERAHYDGAAVAEPARRLALFFFGPIGGSTLAQFMMLAGLVRYESAALRTALAGAASITVWFLVDSGYGLAHDGLFNILIVNVPAIAVTLPPWILLAGSIRRRLLTHSLRTQAN